MLVIIDDRVSRKVCDDVLEVAWSTMWNVTDETAVNCQRFLDGKGMQYFLDCLQVTTRIYSTCNVFLQDGPQGARIEVLQYGTDTSIRNKEVVVSF